MPEEIRNNWLNNIFNENFDIPAHSIVNEWIIRGVNSLNISEQERNDCYNYYYSNHIVSFPNNRSFFYMRELDIRVVHRYR